MVVVGYCMYFRGLINVFVSDALHITSGCIHISNGHIAPLATLWLRAWLEDTSLLECYVVSLGKYFTLFQTIIVPNPQGQAIQEEYLLTACGP